MQKSYISLPMRNNFLTTLKKCENDTCIWENMILSSEYAYYMTTGSHSINQSISYSFHTCMWLSSLLTISSMVLYSITKMLTFFIFNISMCVLTKSYTTVVTCGVVSDYHSYALENTPDLRKVRVAKPWVFCFSVFFVWFPWRCLFSF